MPGLYFDQFTVGQVIETRDDATQIANAVAVAVLKGSRIDLVNGCLLPPFLIVLICDIHAANLTIEGVTNKVRAPCNERQ